MKVVVISDTHAPRRWREMPRAVAGQLVGAEVILHAGDVCVPSVLDELAAYAPRACGARQQRRARGRGVG